MEMKMDANENENENEKWQTNVNVIEKMFEMSLYNPLLLINLLCVCQTFNVIGSRVLTRNGKSCRCQCDCSKMKQRKIEDTIKRWKCQGCDDRIADNCWRASEYSKAEKGEVKKAICKQCFANHWVESMHRPLRMCIKTFD